jgi:hypothetical protein
MPFNIEQFISNIDNVKGLAPASKFDVQITIPNNTKLNELASKREISFLAFSADIPGINLTPDYVFLNGYGRVNEVPVRPNLSECDIGFYIDESNVTYELFYTWINNVVNMDGNNYKSSPNNSRDAYYDEVFYAKEYYSTINLSYLGNKNKLFTIQLLDAFPIQLSGLGLDWNTTDTIATGEVKIAYRAMKVTFEQTRQTQ